MSDTVSTVSPSICHEVMGPDAMILVFWMLSFKPTFSLSSFTFIKRLFSSSSLSAIRVVSSALYLSQKDKTWWNIFSEFKPLRAWSAPATLLFFLREQPNTDEDVGKQAVAYITGTFKNWCNLLIGWLSIVHQKPKTQHPLWARIYTLENIF